MHRFNDEIPKYRKRRPKRTIQVLIRGRKNRWRRVPWLFRFDDWTNYRKYRSMDEAVQAVQALNQNQDWFEYKVKDD